MHWSVCILHLGAYLSGLTAATLGGPQHLTYIHHLSSSQIRQALRLPLIVIHIHLSIRQLRLASTRSTQCPSYLLIIILLTNNTVRKKNNQK